MMHDAEKSDSPRVPRKSANNVACAAAEPMEGRGGTKGNADPQRTVRTQSRRAVSQAQARIREAVNRNRKEKLTALLHHVAVDCLRAAFFALKKRAAAGIDQVTWDQYAENLEENLRGLHRRVQTGAYRASPSRRTYIPKADGKQRPLGIAAIEDKIVQAAVVMILTPIYEAEFLGFSYGFRPGRSQHNALDALAYGIKGRNVRWILDADIRSFFDTISHVWLVRFIEHRIGDKRIVRLIRKWLKALHYVYDLWVHTWRKRHATGDMVVVRYADDTIVGFQHRADAERFLHDLTERLAKFALDLHPEKTRLIEFGRYAAGDRVRRGEGKPETFDFLGFTHICGTMRDGRRFQLKRKTKRKRKRATLQRIVDELRRIRHSPIDGQGRWLATVLRGHYAYFAVPTNLPAVRALRNHVKMHWFLSLRRRSQRSRLTWSRMNVIAAKHLPLPRVLHPWPEQRFLVSHPR